MILDRHAQIASLCERNGMPAISFTRELAMAGLLVSYGPDIGWMYRQAGGQVARVLKGAKPADIFVMQSERFELAVDMRTARRLGVALPSNLLASVSEAVE